MRHHAAVYEKYTGSKYKKASIYVENELKRGFRLSLTAIQNLMRGFMDEDSVLGHRALFALGEN